MGDFTKNELIAIGESLNIYGEYKLFKKVKHLIENFGCDHQWIVRAEKDSIEMRCYKCNFLKEKYA